MPKKQERLIHVKAESEILSVNCLIEESKAVKFLEQTLKNFIWLREKYHKNMNDCLKVQTCVHNPQLF